MADAPARDGEMEESEGTAAVVSSGGPAVKTCSFYQLGRCHFGARCRNLHLGDAQRPPTGVERADTEKQANEGSGAEKPSTEGAGAKEQPAEGAGAKKPLAEGAGAKKPSTEGAGPARSDVKKPPMRTAAAVVSRLQWDPELPREEFAVGYVDRFLGVVEQPFSAFSWGDLASAEAGALSVPQHRIQYFKLGRRVVWDKARRLDHFFGSTGQGITIRDLLAAGGPGRRHLNDHHDGVRAHNIDNDPIGEVKGYGISNDITANEDDITNDDDITHSNDITKDDDITHGDYVTKDDDMTHGNGITKVDNVNHGDDITKDDDITHGDDITKDNDITKDDDITHGDDITKDDDIAPDDNDDITHSNDICHGDDITPDDSDDDVAPDDEACSPGLSLGLSPSPGQRPNYFVAVRISSEEFKAAAREVQERLVQALPSWAAGCVPLSRLHLTLCPLRLHHPAQVEAARSALRLLGREGRRLLPPARILAFGGLRDFDGRVLYAEPRGCALPQLGRLAEELARRFSDLGLCVPGPRPPCSAPLHVTLAKLPRSQRPELRLLPQLYRDWAQPQFGCQAIEALSLCVTRGAGGPEGFYSTVLEVSLY